MIDNIKHTKHQLAEMAGEQIQRLSYLLEQLRDEELLCSNVGEAIIAEFGFKGDKEQVEAQLEFRLMRFETYGLTQKDIIVLSENQKRLDEHQARHDDDPYRLKLKALITVDIAEASKMSDMLHTRKQILHGKKECACYSNRVI